MATKTPRAWVVLTAGTAGSPFAAAAWAELSHRSLPSSSRAPRRCCQDTQASFAATSDQVRAPPLKTCRAAQWRVAPATPPRSLRGMCRASSHLLSMALGPPGSRLQACRGPAGWPAACTCFCGKPCGSAKAGGVGAVIRTRLQKPHLDPTPPPFPSTVMHQRRPLQ